MISAGWAQHGKSVIFREDREMAQADTNSKPRIGLFVTCLVDLFRPSIGFAAIKLLEESGCHVEVPRAQTCCGQPAYNSGDKNDAIKIAKAVIRAFEDYDYIVTPSGSCAGMLKKHYPLLPYNNSGWTARAKKFADRVYELITFLVDVRGMTRVDAQYQGSATYHDSCSGLRELGIKNQPRKLLETVDGLEIVEMKDPEICCGFGGTFSVKYSDISNAIVEKKIQDITSTEVQLVLAGDLGCLMNVAGRASRKESAVELRHVAEVLANMTSAPPICAPKKQKQ